MDENQQRAARRRAIIAFVAAGVLVVADLGLAAALHDRREDRFDRIGDRIERRRDDHMDRRMPGGPMQGPEGRGPGGGPSGGQGGFGHGGYGPGHHGDGRDEPRSGSSSTTTSTTTTTSTPRA